MLDNTGKSPAEILKGVKDGANAYFKATQVGKNTKNKTGKKITKRKNKKG